DPSRFHRRYGYGSRGCRQRFAHRGAARIGADQRRDEQATVPYAFWTRRRGSDTIKLLRSSVRQHAASSRAAPQPAARSFFVPVIESKFVRKLIRRVQFASIVAANPWQGGAMYKLIKQPGAVDSVSLGGLAGSPLIERLKSSPLISTGNALVPVRVAENLYLKGCWDDALALLRKTPGRDAQMKDGWLSLFRGDVDRAMSIFSAAMDRQATKIQACRNLALCHYIQGDLDRAVETVRIGAAMSPKTSSLMTLFSRLVR